MSETSLNGSDKSKFSINRHFWSFYLLGGFQSLAYGGIIVLVVPLSFLMFPNEPYRALEMGILITVLFWLSSLGGLMFGFLIDKFSRKKILFIISLFRGFSMMMLGFAIEGQGMQTWTYFLIFIIIFAFFAGGSWPSIVSLSNDIVPKDHRARFFGLLGIMMGLFTTFGFLIASFCIQYGLWRQYFWGVGFCIIVAGLLLFFHIKEPKRGAQQEELADILNDDSIEYDFQIDRSTLKKTMFSKTNKVALIEGISTNILMGSVVLLVLPYIQTPPHNLSPVFTGLFMIVFGLTGGFIGQILLARYSDKKSADNPIRRIYFIIIALSVGSITFALVFFIPLPNFTKEQGNDIPMLFSHPLVWIMGILFFISNTISSLYLVNQAPILQDINLPEAQGKISAWNQLVENIGWGIGPLMVGILLVITDSNYQLTIFILILFIIPGILLWLLCLKWYPEDRMEIKKILEERAETLKSQQKQNNQKNSS